MLREFIAASRELDALVASVRSPISPRGGFILVASTRARAEVDYANEENGRISGSDARAA